MPFLLYNTLTKKEEAFSPAQEGKVTMYTCGPTVYGRPHIGNYSSFLMADLLRRWLEVGHGYEVTHVKNITDVGHLVADADQGEDKIEKQAREESGAVTHESVIAIARKYEAQFLEDEQALNMLEPFKRPRASEYIEPMKAMIECLLASGHAYATSDGIYFDVTSKTPTPYGTLSGNLLENLNAGSRVHVNEEKKHPADFALWKFCIGLNEHHALRWASPGEGNPEGFPGWHIECSAMSSALLGEQIDIHTGGEDNIFPHHECEIAQSECVSGKKPFVTLWLHRRRIDMGKEKMSKSLGNVLNLDDIRAMGYSPMDLRYLFLSVHYRTQLKFDEKGLDDARKARRKIVEWMSEPFIALPTKPGVGNVQAAEQDIVRIEQTFDDAMNSDLNTPAALAAIFEMMSMTRTALVADVLAKQRVREFIDTIRRTFGCFDPEEDEAVPAEVAALFEERAKARAAKDFAASDRLRDAIAAMGYQVRDGADGQTLRKL